MKGLFVILLFLICNIANSQQYLNQTGSLGVGLVMIKNTYSPNDKVTFYNDNKLSNKSEDFFITQPNSIRFPKFYKPDYGICYFVCLEKTANYFKILVNEKDVKFIGTDSNSTFINWPKLLLKSTGIRVLNINQHFYIQAFTESLLANIKPDHILTVISVKNDWVEIKDQITKNVGWFQWKKNDQLTIEILLLE